MKVLEMLTPLKASVMAVATGLFSCAAFAGTDLDPLTVDGVLTIPSSTTVTIDDDNAAAFGSVTGVTFAATTSRIQFSTQTEIESAQTYSGKGALGVYNGGKVLLSGDSADFSGKVNITNSNVRVSSRNALGKSTVEIYNTSSDPYQLTFEGEGLTTDAKIDVYGTKPSRFQRDNYADMLTFNGKVRNMMDYQLLTLGTSRFNGGIDGNKQVRFEGADKTCEIWFKKQTYPSNVAIFTGIYHFLNNDNKFSLALTMQGSNVKVVCETNNCLATSAGDGILNFREAASAGTRWLDLNGFDQDLKAVSTYSVTGIGEGGATREVIRSATPARLKVSALKDGSRNTITSLAYPFQFQGEAGFLCNIPANATLSIINAVSDTTGTLDVRRGSLEFKWKAGWGGTNVVVSGGNLIFNSPNSITNDQTRLVVTNGTLTLNVDVHVGSALIGGTELARGEYTAAKLPGGFVSGGGKLYVDYYPGEIVYKTYHWTGAGSDDLLTTRENWQENEVPDFTACGATLVFGDDELCRNFRATVAGEICVNRLVFAGTNAFALAAADENALITTGSVTENEKTIVVSNANPQKDAIPTNVIEVAVHTTSAFKEEWNVAPYSAIDFRGPISGSGSASITLRPICLTNLSPSYGLFILSGDNVGLERQFVLQGGNYLFRHENALGSPTRAADFFGLAGVRFFFDCLTNNVPISQGGTQINSGRLWCDPEKGLVMNGKLSPSVGQTGDFTGVTFCGGISGDNFQPNGSFAIEGRAVKFGGVQGALQNGGSLALSVTGNDWSRWYFRYASTLVCGALDVLDGDRMVEFGAGDSDFHGTLDLNGFDQTCAGFDRYTYNTKSVNTPETACNAVVTSAVPATVTWSGQPKSILDNSATFQNISPTSGVRFVDRAGLTVNASASVRHTVINARSTAVAPLAVKSGTLVLAWGAGWTATTNVVISGANAKLVIEKESAPTAFGARQGASKAFLSVMDGGTLQIDGGQATAYALSTDGEVFLEPGVYGGSEAGLDAAHTLSCLSGKGTLKVRTNGTPNGIVLIVR